MTSIHRGRLEHKHFYNLNDNKNVVEIVVRKLRILDDDLMTSKVKF